MKENSVGPLKKTRKLNKTTGILAIDQPIDSSRQGLACRSRCGRRSIFLDSLVTELPLINYMPTWYSNTCMQP